jgi:deoxyinosine 3'endonuclease (endonuclease V)
LAELIRDGEVIGTRVLALRSLARSKLPALRSSQRSRVLRTQDGINPVFVSIGHRIDLPGAQQIVLPCAIRFAVSRTRPVSPTDSSALRSGRWAL